MSIKNSKRQTKKSKTLITLSLVLVLVLQLIIPFVGRTYASAIEEGVNITKEADPEDSIVFEMEAANENPAGEAADDAKDDISETLNNDLDGTDDIKTEIIDENTQESNQELSIDSDGKLQEKTISFEADGIRIEVSGQAGVIPEGTTLKVEPLSKDEVDLYVSAIQQNTHTSVDYATVFDITLLNEVENEIQPNGNVKVSFYGLDHIKEHDNVTIHHVERQESNKGFGIMSTTSPGNNAALEEFSTKVENGKISFTTNHFSIYVVSGTGSGQGTSNNRYQMLLGETLKLGKRDYRVEGWRVESGSGNITTNSDNTGTFLATTAGNMTVQSGYYSGYFNNTWNGLNRFYISVTDDGSTGIVKAGTNEKYESSTGNQRYQMNVGDTVDIEALGLTRGTGSNGWSVSEGSSRVTFTSTNITNNMTAKVTATQAGDVTIRYRQPSSGHIGDRNRYFYIRINEAPADPPAVYPGDPTIPETHITPGAVTTSKIAVPVPGTVNTWNITVRVEAEDPESVTSDIVLVIDTSSSMNNESRLDNAKIAASNFIDKFINDTNVRIGVVNFDEYAYSRVLSNTNADKSAHKLFINGLQKETSKGTFTQAGIKAAQDMLNSIPQAERADRQYIIILSDGQPTYSYAMTDINTRRNNTYFSQRSSSSSNWDSRDYFAPSPFDYRNDARTGSGVAGNRGSAGSSGGSNYYYHHGNSAIAEARYAKLADSIIYSIAYVADSEGERVLKNMASSEKYFEATPGTIDAIFNEIAVGLSSTIQSGNIVDVMGDGFEIPAHRVGSITKTQGTVDYDDETKTLDWNLGGALTTAVPGNPNKKYAEMKYTVEINDEMIALNLLEGENGVHPTNKSIEFNYKDPNGKDEKITDTTSGQGLASPKVDPVLLKMKKILKDENGNVVTNDPRKFNVNLNKLTPNGFNHTEPLAPGGDYVWLTTLRYEGTYNVEETSITGDGLTNLDAYTISYAIDGVATNNFLVDHNSTIDSRTGMETPRRDITIEVTNKKIGDARSDDPLIRISKTFSGLTQTQIDQLTSFKIRITSSSDPAKTKDLLLVDATRVVEANGDITYKWELDGWPAGTYTVTESGYDITDYDVGIDNAGEVTTKAATISWTNVLEKKANTQVNNDLRVNEISPNIVATKLSSGEGVFVWTETRLSASQRLAIVNALSGYSELGLTMNNGYWYSGEDIAGTNFYFRGYRIQYDLEAGNLHIPQSNQWALIVSGKYEFVGGDPADIGVKNTYTMKTVDVTISKEVTGNMGDMTGPFSFSVQVGEEDNPRSFSISHGQSHTLEDIPINAVLTLTEASREHDITVKIGGAVIELNDGKYTIDLAGYNAVDGKITIEVTNDKDETIDTGITLDSLPYIIILALVIAGIGVIFIRRRRIRNQD